MTADYTILLMAEIRRKDLIREADVYRRLKSMTPRLPLRRSQSVDLK